MKHINFLILFILSFGTLSAQNEFRQGYIIKSEGDTLFGVINYRGYIRMGKVCIFKQNNNSKKIIFYPTVFAKLPNKKVAKRTMKKLVIF